MLLSWLCASASIKTGVRISHKAPHCTTMSTRRYQLCTKNSRITDLTLLIDETSKYFSIIAPRRTSHFYFDRDALTKSLKSLSDRLGTKALTTDTVMLLEGFHFDDDIYVQWNNGPRVNIRVNGAKGLYCEVQLDRDSTRALLMWIDDELIGISR